MGFRQRIKALPFLGPFLKHIWQYYFLKKTNPAWLLKNEFKNTKNVFIVQVGSNDGKTGDPLHYLVKKNTGWKGLFIEPVPFLFDRLKKNYGYNSKYLFENVAIGLQKEKKDFFYVDPNAKSYLHDLPEYFDQLNSFNKDHLVNHFGNQISDHIICTKVPVETLQAVLDKHKINSIDILHIDTEGYDWIVLQQLDLTRYSPQVILFEYKNLTEDSRNLAIDYLKNKYVMINMEGDFYCKRLS